MTYTQVPKGRGPSRQTGPDTITARCRWNAHRLEVVFSFGESVISEVNSEGPISGLTSFSFRLLKGTDDASGLLRFELGEGPNTFRVRREGSRFTMRIFATRLGCSETFDVREIPWKYYETGEGATGIEVLFSGFSTVENVSYEAEGPDEEDLNAKG